MLCSGYLVDPASLHASLQAVLLTRGGLMRCKYFFVLVGLFVILFSTALVFGQLSFYQPPTYAGSGTLFGADFNGDGKPDLLTSDGTMNLGNGDGTFRLGTPVSVASDILVVADFNGDGKADILEDQVSTWSLFVLLGRGDGTFQAPIASQIALPAEWVGTAAIDLNSDGRADVVLLSGSAVLVYLGKGDGTFASAVSYSLGVTPNPTALAFGDVNGDNRVDILVSVPGTAGPGQEICLLGNGDGTFQAPKTSNGVSNPAMFAVTGDFNGDGRLDVAVAGVYILFGNGDGTFQPPVASVSSGSPAAAADVNGDGKMDLILQPNGPASQIYLGNGDGTFRNTTNYLLSFPPLGGSAGVVVADFNADGKLDIAAGNGVLLGNGDGTFQGIRDGPGVYAPLIGRFNKTGAPEVAGLSSGFTILANDGTGFLTLAYLYPLQVPQWMYPEATLAGDFNGDGNPDVIVIYVGAPDPMHQSWLMWGYVSVLGNGDGTFQTLWCIRSQALGRGAHFRRPWATSTAMASWTWW